MGTIRQKKEQRRTLLLEAALELFATHGYEATTTKAIAERAGVTEAMVFRHFASKRDLFRATVTEFGPRRLFVDVMQDRPDLPLADLLTRVVTDYLETFWQNRAWMRLMFRESGSDPGLFHEFREQNREQNRRLQQLLAARAARGEMRAEMVEAAVDVFAAANIGFLLRSLRQEPKDWTVSRDGFVRNLIAITLPALTPAT